MATFPAAPKMRDVWRGRASPVNPDADPFASNRSRAQEYSWFNYNSNYNKTVPLQFGLENRGTKPATIVGGYLDISRSRLDAQPALQSLPLHFRSQSVDFSIENYGWSAAHDARLTLNFVNPAKGLRTDPASIAIGEISAIQQFSFAPALEQFGVRRTDLPRIAAPCRPEPE
jgi:hypothetical protein